MSAMNLGPPSATHVCAHDELDISTFSLSPPSVTFIARGEASGIYRNKYDRNSP